MHLTAETVEVLYRGVRVASHVRSYEPGKATTLTEHMPKAHQKYRERYVNHRVAGDLFPGGIAHQKTPH